VPGFSFVREREKIYSARLQPFTTGEIESTPVVESPPPTVGPTRVDGRPSRTASGSTRPFSVIGSFDLRGARRTFVARLRRNRVGDR
jgi:hypothetical protein